MTTMERTFTIDETRANQIMQLYADSEFCAAVKTLKTTEELRNLFAKNGIHMTLDEVDDYCIAIAEYREGADFELSESQLDDVAGGSISLTVCLVIGGIIVVGAFALGVYHGIKDKRR